MKIIVTIEARMSSTRLPGKVLLPILGKPALEHMIQRVKAARYVDEIVIATTTNSADDEIVSLCQRLGVGYYRGSEDNVLERVYLAAKTFKADLICKLTGDCPLIDPLIIDHMILEHLNGKYDYSSNRLNERSYAIGFDTEVFDFNTLEKTYQSTKDIMDLTHVTCYIYHHPQKFKLHAVNAPISLQSGDLRITLDTIEDFTLIEKIFKALQKDESTFSAYEIVHFLRNNPSLILLNKDVRQKKVEEG